VPTLGDLTTDEGQDEIGDLIAKEKASEALFVLQMGLTQAEGALEISEHFLNPETLLVPGDRLIGVAKGSAKIPNTVPQATNDNVDGDRFLISILDVGEDDGRSFYGVELAQRAGPAAMVYKGVRAEANDIGKALFLEQRMNSVRPKPASAKNRGVASLGSRLATSVHMPRSSLFWLWRRRLG
jgi:hypothetical protein